MNGSFEDLLQRVRTLTRDNNIMEARLLANQDTINNLIDFISSTSNYKVSYVPVRYKLKEPVVGHAGLIYEIHSMTPIFTADFDSYMENFSDSLRTNDGTAG